MSDAEAKNIYDEMIIMFGSLPNHSQEPIRFQYYYTLYKYYKSQEV